MIKLIFANWRAEVLYFVSLIFYMQAIPLRLIWWSLAANIVVLIFKLWRGY